MTTLQVASMLLAATAQAQADPCEQLKATLAARLDASGVRGYVLETVPARVPVPPGAKVIGNCQGGASKILYRRSGGATPPSDDAEAARPAAKPQAIVVPKQPIARPPAASAVAPPLADASEVATAPPDDRAAAPSPPPPDKPAAAKDPATQPASGFLSEHWRWFGALAFVLILALIWAWHTRRSAYDDAGLPRGPKL